MDYDFNDCYDEIEDITIKIDYKVLNGIQQDKQRIKRQNKKNKLSKLNIENKE
ncbi:MAG: hypothetical protein PHT02_00105 [Tissierellia bacterium]|nr:hypothetical protein [Tissierellia bacterium]